MTQSLAESYSVCYLCPTSLDWIQVLKHLIPKGEGMRHFHRPVRRASDILEELSGEGDPADLSLAAHDTAAILVLLAKDSSPEIRTRLTQYLEREGIEDLLALWKQAAPLSLPSAL